MAPIGGSELGEAPAETVLVRRGSAGSVTVKRKHHHHRSRVAIVNLKRSRSMPGLAFANDNDGLKTIEECSNDSVRQPPVNDTVKQLSDSARTVSGPPLTLLRRRSREQLANSARAVPGSPKLSLSRRKSRDYLVMEENYEVMMEKFQFRKLQRRPSVDSSWGSDRIAPLSDSDSTESAGNEVASILFAKELMGRRPSLHRIVRQIRHSLWIRLSKPMAPDSTVQQCIQIVLLAFFGFQIVFVPLHYGFMPGPLPSMAVLHVLIECVLMLDCVLQFNVAFYSKGRLVVDRRKIAQRYATTWMIPDVLSSIPVDTISLIETGSIDLSREVIGIWQSVPRFAHIVVAVKVFWVLRLFRHGRDFWKWLAFSRYSHLLRIMQMMGLVVLTTHYVACFWEILCPTTPPEPPYTSEVVKARYAHSFYNAIQLIQGQSIETTNTAQEVYASLAILVGSLVLALVFGNVAMLVANFNANSKNYQRKLENVFATMKKLQLPQELQERIHQYYDHLWLAYESLDGDIVKFSRELSHTLALEVGLCKYMGLVLNICYWRECSPDFVTQILLRLVVRVYLPDDYVMRQGEVGDQLFMINQGVCELTLDEHCCEHSTPIVSAPIGSTAIEPRISFKSSKCSPAGRRLLPGQAFGELALIMNYQRTTNVRALSHVEMCVIYRRDFQFLLSRYTKDRRNVLVALLKPNMIHVERLPEMLRDEIATATAAVNVTNPNLPAELQRHGVLEKVVDAIILDGEDEHVQFGIRRHKPKKVDVERPAVPTSTCPTCQTGFTPHESKIPEPEEPPSGPSVATVESDPPAPSLVLPASRSSGASALPPKKEFVTLPPLENASMYSHSMAGQTRRLEEQMKEQQSQLAGLMRGMQELNVCLREMRHALARQQAPSTLEELGLLGPIKNRPSRPRSLSWRAGLGNRLRLPGVTLPSSRRNSFDASNSDASTVRSISQKQLRVLVRLHGVGKRAINGYYNRYDDRYPAALDALEISRNDFQMCMIAVNQTCDGNFPDTVWLVLGYVLLVLTCGLSYYCWAQTFTDELETKMSRIMQRINCKDVFLDQHLQWSLRQGGYETWIEIAQWYDPPQRRATAGSTEHSALYSPTARTGSLPSSSPPLFDGRSSIPPATW
ncbi:TPA: hypothetical protein N0F65_009819 [Lagenidium giganteum]|uniref:Cyclic nucleotide-binding domain-containing protein n=1 Tax=Lagenidium giganteum TaxID=4803 RepID=A0AAV2YUB8_9STRA|nr:TPA: hypothetical protein N0F65_009819 [Lagenidium giganteum]